MDKVLQTNVRKKSKSGYALKTRSFLILMRSIRKITRSYTVINNIIVVNCWELGHTIFYPSNCHVDVQRVGANVRYSFKTDYSATSLFKKMQSHGLICDDRMASIKGKLPLGS